MADQPNTGKNEFTPDDLREARSNFDPSALSQEPDQDNPIAQGKPQPTAAELAEQQRRDEKDLNQDSRSRDDRLVESGRGHQTAGRLGGVK
jgi:hypothetical protein